MSLEAPDAFFLRNGGEHLLRANGIHEDLSIHALCSKGWSTWPKEDGSVKNTRFGIQSQDGVICAWEGGLELRSPAMLRLPDELPAHLSIHAGKAMAERGIVQFAQRCLDLPRPLMFLTVGASYGPAVRTAKLTFDPNMIDATGSTPFLLDRENVEEILVATQIFFRSPFELRTDRQAVEKAALRPDDPECLSMNGRLTTRHPNHPATIRRIAGHLRIDGFQPRKPSPEHTALLASYWKDIAALPASDDAAWSAAQGMFEDQQIGGQESAA